MRRRGPPYTHTHTLHSIGSMSKSVPATRASRSSLDQKNPFFVSVKFVVSAILGPEMAAPIVWTPGKNAFFLQENPFFHKIPRFRGGFWGFWGGGSADFIFMGARIFLILTHPPTPYYSSRPQAICICQCDRCRAMERSAKCCCVIPCR